MFKVRSYFRERHFFSSTENELNDESTCECPCQCIQGQEQANLCPVRSKPENPIDSVCPPEVQRVDAGNPLPRDVMLTSLPLPPCFERDCGRWLSKESCFGVIGCSWCEKEVTPGGGKPQQVRSYFLIIMLNFETLV